MLLDSGTVQTNTVNGEIFASTSLSHLIVNKKSESDMKKLQLTYERIL